MSRNNRLSRKNTIIFVTGGPGTGKSYASEFLTTHIEGLTLLSYDQIKEKEWDRFGFDNTEQKDRLNWFSLEEYYLTVQKLMWEGKTILTEYPFYQRHREALWKLVENYHYHGITILLYGDWKTIYERGKNRDHCIKRHPGHLTNCYHLETYENRCEIKPDAALSYEEFRRNIDSKNYDIQIGTTIKIDVTDLSQIDYNLMLKQIYEIDRQQAEYSKCVLQEVKDE